jgi:hypothetical protein
MNLAHGKIGQFFYSANLFGDDRTQRIQSVWFWMLYRNAAALHSSLPVFVVRRFGLSRRPILRHSVSCR